MIRILNVQKRSRIRQTAEKEYALGFPTSVLDMEMKNRMNIESLIEFDGWLVLTEGLITAAVGG